MKSLKNKKILITAGPVWVPIDQVRVITNVFGGALGYVIADEACKMGASVHLVMGPGRVVFSGKEKFKITKFKYYEDIYNILKKEISSKNYDVVMQSAAIPDYVPRETKKGKIKSGKDNFVIKFKPTKKIIDEFRKWDKNIYIVKFKLEVGLNKKQLIEVAYNSMKFSKADLMVANELGNISDNHKAYIIDNEQNIVECSGKKEIAKKMLLRVKKDL